MEQASIFGTPLGPLLGHEQRSRSISGLGAAVFDLEVQQAQKLVNGVLRPLGFQTIGTDGKIGPETCGAVLYLDKELPVVEANLVPTAWESLWRYMDARPRIADGCATSYGRGVATWPKRLSLPQLPVVMPPLGLPEGVPGPVWVAAVQRLQLALNYALAEMGYGIRDDAGSAAALREDGGLDADVCGVVDFVWKAIKAGTPLASTKAVTDALHAPIGQTTVSDVLYPMCGGLYPWPAPIKESAAAPPAPPPPPSPPPAASLPQASQTQAPALPSSLPQAQPALPGTAPATAKASSTPWIVGGAIGAAALAAVFLLRK
jgi:hypothetical protein